MEEGFSYATDDGFIIGKPESLTLHIDVDGLCKYKAIKATYGGVEHTYDTAKLKDALIWILKPYETYKNPSYECMRVAREESRAELLEMRRWDVAQMLREIEFGAGSHENLSAIANVIYEPCFGWTKSACEYLRDQLVYLIGGERDAQHGCSDGAGGCVCHDVQEEVGGQSRTCPESGLDVSESDDGASVTSELREYLDLNGQEFTNYKDELIATISGGTSALYAIADRIDEQFARICEQQEKVLQDTIGEMQDEIERQRGVRDELQVKLDESQAKLDEFEKFDPEIAIAAFGDDNAELRKLLSRTAKLLASAERDRDENYANWMDCKQKVLQSNITVGELTDERDELQGIIADLDDQLERRKDKCLRYKTHIDQMQGGSKRLRKELAELQSEYDHVKRMCYENAKYAVNTDEKACMYLNLLRDAARDYKALQDKLNLVFGMWVSATGGGE